MLSEVFPLMLFKFFPLPFLRQVCNLLDFASKMEADTAAKLKAQLRRLCAQTPPLKRKKRPGKAAKSPNASLHAKSASAASPKKHKI